MLLAPTEREEAGNGSMSGEDRCELFGAWRTEKEQTGFLTGIWCRGEEGETRHDGFRGVLFWESVAAAAAYLHGHSHNGFIDFA